MKLNEMHERRKALISERDALVASTEMTVEQEARGHEVANELQQLDGQIRAAQLRERFASYSAMESAVTEGQKRNADWTATTEYRDQFLGWCRGGRAPETRDLTTASSGVLVPKVYEAGILKYLDRNTVVRNLADLRTGVKGSVTLRVNTLETDQAITNFWTTEASKTATAIDAGFSEVNLNPVGGLPKSELTHWLVRQSDFDIEAEVMDHLQRQIARGIESAYTVGNPTTSAPSPTGCFMWDTNYKSVAVSAAHGSGAGWDGAFTVANLTQLRYGTLPAEYWTEAAWIMSQDAYYTIAKIVAASGSNVPLFVPSSDAGVVGAAPFTLMGRPVYIAPYAPGRQTAAVSNSVPLMFANLREAFAIREWGGISMFRDEVTTPGLVKFQGMIFANSKVIRPKAVAALRITLT